MGREGDWRLYFLNRDRIEQVTPAQIKDVAEKYFTTSNRTVGFFVPTAKRERTPIPAVSDLAKVLKGYTGRQLKSGSSEASDVSPLAIEARLLRPDPIGGVKLGVSAQKYAWRVGPGPADPSLWRCRKPQGTGRRDRIFAHADRCAEPGT